VEKRVNNYNETLYNENFYKQISEIIGESQEFNKKTKLEQNLIHSRLKDLSVLSEITNMFKENLKLDFYSEERSRFNSIIKEELSVKIDRKDSNSLVNQLNISVKLITKHLLDKGYVNECFKKSLNNDYLKKIFDLILITIVSSITFISKDGLEDCSSISYKDVDYGVIVKNLTKNLITSIGLGLIRLDNSLISNLRGLYKDVPYILYNNSDEKKNQCFIKCSSQLLLIFIDVFQLETRIVNYKNEKGEFKSIKLIRLSEDLYDSNISSTHIPEIVKPKTSYDIIEDDIKYYKPVKNGLSSLDMSSKTLKALKISQNKVFFINNKAIKLFKNLDELDYEKIKNLKCLPFTPISKIYKIESDLSNLKKSIPENLLNKYFEAKRSNI
jgi:hypothetical protein